MTAEPVSAAPLPDVPTDVRGRRYSPPEIEGRWQRQWEADGLYVASTDSNRPKYYALVMFPYTSGDLHLGHWWNFALADVHTRYKRMQGYAVLFPPGFDAFGGREPGPGGGFDVPQLGEVVAGQVQVAMGSERPVERRLEVAAAGARERVAELPAVHGRVGDDAARLGVQVMEVGEEAPHDRVVALA